MEGGTCTIVYVPADSAAPLEEWQIPVPEGQEVECVVNRLRQHYSQKKSSKDNNNGIDRNVNTEDEEARTFKEQLRAQINENAAKMGGNDTSSGGSGSGGNVTDEMLEAAAGLQLVETVALLPGGKKNNYEHVNMYCDDRAISKNSIVNSRACGIASTCGLKTLQVRGDVFIGKLIESDEQFERLNFTLQDLDSSSKWMQVAHNLNMAKVMGNQSAENEAAISRMQAMAAESGANIFTKQSHATSHKEMQPEVSKMNGDGVTPIGSLYTWTQAEDEVVIDITCPKHTTSKDVKCTFGSQSIKIVVDTLESESNDKIVLDGKLFQRIDIDGSTWTLDSSMDSKVLQVTLSKEKEMRWLVLTR